MVKEIMNKNKTTILLASLTIKLSGAYQEKNIRIANEHGLNEAEFRCLRFFGFDKGLSNRKIAKRMNLSESRLTRIIDGLVSKGYMTKKYDRKDWRALRLNLSRKGKLFALKLEKENVDIHSKILKEIKTSQHKALILLLENVNSVLNKELIKHK